MKTRLFTFLFFVSMLTGFAQRAQRCDEPLPEQEFRRKLKSISMQVTDESRLKVANSFVANYCLTVSQVKTIAALFQDDFNRLDFAKTAWATTLDKEDFYFVFDDFCNFSTAFLLYDYVQDMEHQAPQKENPRERPVNINFPPMDYPAYENYRGPSNCKFPLNDDDFMRFARQAAANNSEPRLMLLLTQLAEGNCLSVSQVMKLASMLASEQNRLNFFKTAYPSVFDLKNLPAGAQLFDQTQNRAAYNEFIRNQAIGFGPDVPLPCIVEADDFNQIKESISKESFSSTKISLAKQILRTKQCFSVRQVSELLRLITFEDARLDLAKFAYEYTTDRDNYYKIADVFTFSKSKDDLMKFLEGKR
jgi:hypothetical protein